MIINSIINIKSTCTLCHIDVMKKRTINGVITVDCRWMLILTRQEVCIILRQIAIYVKSTESDTK